METPAAVPTRLVDRPWLVPTVLGLAAGGVLLAGLGTPGDIYFDETYYVNDARAFLETGVDEGFAVHPPVGKWLIAAGIALVGDTPVGWRIAGALAGVATVLLTWLLARSLLGRDHPTAATLAALAPLLLLTDGLFIAQSRIAMLDTHLVLLTTLALWLLVVDHRRRVRGAVVPWRPSLRVLAGVVLGLAVGTKWSGLLALGAAGLLTIGWELAAARRDTPEAGRGWVRSVPRRAAAVVGSLVVVPAVVYALTWVPWVANFAHTYTATTTPCGASDVTACEFTLGERVAGWWKHQGDMLDFHLGLEATHGYRSDPLGWPVLERPVVYHWESCPQERAAGVLVEDPDTGTMVPPDPCVVPPGDASEVLAVGNPVLWWGWVLLLPVLVGGAGRRDGRSAVPLVGWASLWLPWLAVSRTAFLFYLAPAVPLMAVGAVVALDRIGGATPVRRDYAFAVNGALLGFAATASVGALGVLDEVSVRALAAAAVVGWTVAPLVGAVPAIAGTPPPQDARPRVGRRLAVAFASAQVAAFAWFVPVWLAIPLSEDAIRARWWFSTWI